MVILDLNYQNPKTEQETLNDLNLETFDILNR
jgi:hypothetical protein